MLLPSWLQWLIGVATSIACLPLRLLKWALQSGDEAYGSLDHLALNVSRPKTEWLNMGNWEHTDEFPIACHNLASLLYEEAGLSPNASVLDVGHGSGDSLLLLAKEYCPTTLHGVTSMPSHALRARKRLSVQEKQQQQQVASSVSWEVFCDDAVAYLDHENTPKYDFILALDCAYHFQTRKAFLKACKQRLNAGGKVALIDLVASHPYPAASTPSFTPSYMLPPPTHAQGNLSSRIKHYIVTLMTGVPMSNLIPIKQYFTDLEQAGFLNAKVKDISHLIFPGFATFLQGLGKGDEADWRGGGLLQTAALRSFGSVVEGWGKGGQEGMVRCIVVVA